METAAVEVSCRNGNTQVVDKVETPSVMEELHKQRETLKQNLHEMDKSIKKLTGRDPDTKGLLRTPASENRRSSGLPIRRVPLKRESLGNAGGSVPNKRRWGNTAFNNAKIKTDHQLDSGGEEEDVTERRKPTMQSSVVVTGKPIDTPTEQRTVDDTMKKRNKRMFGLLLGTLKQFKQDSQMKTETESKQEEKLIQVEEKVQREKEEIIERKKDLIETRQGKKLELQELEFKIAMTELNEDLKAHYTNFDDVIRLKSTPCIFYKPAMHNAKTEKLLKESQESFRESLEQRMKEISLCTEEDIRTARVPWDSDEKRKSRTREDKQGRLFRYNNQRAKLGKGKNPTDPIDVDHAPTSKRQPITVRDDDDVDTKEVTVIEDNNSITTEDEEDIVHSKEIRSVVVGANLDNTNHKEGEKVADMEKHDIDDGEELSYTDWGKFGDDEQGREEDIEDGIDKHEVKYDEPNNLTNQDLVEGNHYEEDEHRDINEDEKFSTSLQEEETISYKKEVNGIMDVVDESHASIENEEEIDQPGPPGDDEHYNSMKELMTLDNIKSETADADVIETLDQPIDTEDCFDVEEECVLPLEDIQLPPDPADPKTIVDDNQTVVGEKQENDRNNDSDTQNVFTDLLPTGNVMESYIDDFEYAEQLLEEVVDKERSLLSPTPSSYKVVDERLYTKTNEKILDVTDQSSIEISLMSNSSWHDG